MKTHYIIINFILLAALLICLLSCLSTNGPSLSGDYTVIDVRYVHDLPYATRLKARQGQMLLQVVKILVIENKKGERVIIVGGPSEGNTAIYFMGIENDAMTFQLVPSGADPGVDPEPDEILRFHRDAKRIELWGNHFEIIAVSAYGIQCRVAAPDTGI